MIINENQRMSETCPKTIPSKWNDFTVFPNSRQESGGGWEFLKKLKRIVILTGYRVDNLMTSIT